MTTYGKQPLSSEEIGFAELVALVQRYRGLIVGMAVVSGLVALLVTLWLAPVAYLATARLIVNPLVENQSKNIQPISLYRALLESDSILQRTTDRLISEDVLPIDTLLVLGKDLSSRIEISGGGRNPGSVITLTARGDDPQTAANLANTWGQVFIEESRLMLRSPSATKKVLLSNELTPTRRRLEGLEDGRTKFLDEFQQLELAASNEWNERISTAKAEAEREVAKFQTETRRLMEEAGGRYLRTASGASDPAAEIQIKLLEIVTVRSELAKTSRILSLEKSVSEETLAELILKGEDLETFGTTLISQEVNPLFNSLSTTIFQLESELKRGAGMQLDSISTILTELEKIQLERGAGLAVLIEKKSFRLRTLRLEKSSALEELLRKKNVEMSELAREIDQLKDLEQRLSTQVNETALSELLEQVDVIKLAAPAVPRADAEPRRVLLKATLGALLGGMLGVLMALFRSTSLQDRATDQRRASYGDSEV